MVTVTESFGVKRPSGFVLAEANSSLSGYHDDTTLISMYEAPKVSAEGHGRILQGPRSR